MKRYKSLIVVGGVLGWFVGLPYFFGIAGGVVSVAVPMAGVVLLLALVSFGALFDDWES